MVGWLVSHPDIGSRALQAFVKICGVGEASSAGRIVVGPEDLRLA